MKKWVLGIGGSDHDFSATLASGTDIRVSIEEERLSRVKHGPSLWYQNPIARSLNYCLDACGICLTDIDHVVSSDSLPIKVRDELASIPISLYSHHLCHAASAYVMLPPKSRAAILVYDGWGSNVLSSKEQRYRRETFSFYLAGPDGISCLGQRLGLSRNEPDDYPIGVCDSIGMLYEIATSAIGFNIMDAGKTMGLAAYGQPLYYNVLRSFMTLGNEFGSCFECMTDSPHIYAAIREIIENGTNSFAVKADLACSIQVIINEVLMHCVNLFSGNSFDYLCLAGGCALNTVANSELIKRSPFSVPIVIPPHCSDAGLGLGALYLYTIENDCQAEITFKGGTVNPGIARPGRIYSSEDCQRAVNRVYPQLARDTSLDSLGALAGALAGGAVIGFFNGPSEIGPRALGGRSILADPRDGRVREVINRRFKGREPFRPLAPMVLAEEFDSYFQSAAHADPFMLKVADAKPRCLREAPAIVHADGTARVQVVGPDGDPVLRHLLYNFKELTGLPMLLNTSFNRRGEPIVESPADAVDSCLGMELDGLYLDGAFYRRAEVYTEHHK